MRSISGLRQGRSQSCRGRQTLQRCSASGFAPPPSRRLSGVPQDRLSFHSRGPGRAPVRPAASGGEAKAVAGDRHSKDAPHRGSRPPPEPQALWSASGPPGLSLARPWPRARPPRRERRGSQSCRGRQTLQRCSASGLVPPEPQALWSASGLPELSLARPRPRRQQTETTQVSSPSCFHASSISA